MDDNFFQEDWMLHRKSLLEQMSIQRHKVRLWGDTRRRVGDVITLNIPTSQVHGDLDDSMDKNVGGRFLITYIKHIINTIAAYTHEMVL